MPRIIVCEDHQKQGFPPTIEGTPTAFDEPGAFSAHLAVEVPQPGGVPRLQLDCAGYCRWAPDPADDIPAVEKTLGSVGDPTLVKKAKKEKKMPKEKATTTPKKQDRRRSKVLTRKFGPNEVTLIIPGGMLDYLLLNDDEQADLAMLVEKMGVPKAEASTR